MKLKKQVVRVMFGSRRLIPILVSLSVALQFPGAAFARGFRVPVREVQVPASTSSVPAREPATDSGFEGKLSRASATPAATTSSSRQVPRSVAELINKPEIFTIHGKTYSLLSRYNSSGVVTSQMLIGPERQEFMIDPDGDGEPDAYEIKSKDGVMRFSNSMNGRFYIMEIDHGFRSGKVTLRFAWNPKNGGYDLIGTNARPYKRLFWQDFIIGCRGDEHEQVLQRTALDLIGLFKRDYNGEKAELRTEFEKNLLGESCRTGDFESSTDEILDAMMKVAETGLEWDGNKPSSKGSFMQCLRYYELDVHASRIQSGFAQFTSLVPENQRFKWKVECKRDPSVPGPGSYLDATPPSMPSVSFHDTVTDMDETGLLGRAGAVNEYADTFFHEMLHYSGIEDEGAAHMITDCCAEGASESTRSSSCENLEKFVEKKKNAQRMENLVIEASNGKYPLLLDEIRQAYGPGAAAAIDDFYMNMADIYSKTIGSEKCVEAAKNPQKKGMETQQEKCRTQFLNELGSGIQDYYSGGDNSRCVKKVRQRMGETSAEFCHVSAAIAAKMLGLNMLELKMNIDAAKPCLIEGRKGAMRDDSVGGSGIGVGASDVSGGSRSLSGLPGLWDALLPRAFASDAFNPLNNSCEILAAVKPIPVEAYEKLAASSYKPGAMTGGGTSLYRVTVPPIPAETVGGRGGGSNAQIETPSSGGGGRTPVQVPRERPQYLFSSSRGAAGSKGWESGSREERTREIASHLERSENAEGLLESTRQVAQKVFRSLAIPEARAADVKRSESGSRTNPVPRRELASVTIPDPFDRNRNGSEVGGGTRARNSTGSPLAAESGSAGEGAKFKGGPHFQSVTNHFASGDGNGGDGGSSSNRSDGSGHSGDRRGGKGDPGSASERGPLMAGEGAGRKTGSDPGAGALTAGGPQGTTAIPTGTQRGIASQPEASESERELDELLRELQGPYKSVLKKLKRSAVISRLLRFHVRVRDDKNHEYGSDVPRFHLNYDASIGRLKLKPSVEP